VNKLSVIITTLNAGKFIRSLLNSLKNQDTQTFDIIIVDGGSVDGTVDIINSYKLVNLLVQPGVSIYGGLNIAIEACKTPYYLICGADDFIYSHAINTVLADIERIGDPDIVLYSVKKGGLIVKPNYPSKFRRILGWQSIISSHSVGSVIKTNLHNKLGMYSERYKILADGYFFSEVFSYTKSVYISENVIGEFSIQGISNKNFYENIFTMFLIQIKSHAFFPQLILLVFRLVKYRSKGM